MLLVEILVLVSSVEMDPLLALLGEASMLLLVHKRQLDLIVNASELELLESAQNRRRVILFLEMHSAILRVRHYSLSVGVDGSLSVTIRAAGVACFVVIAHDAPLGVSRGLLTAVGHFVGVHIASQLLQKFPCVRASEQNPVDEVHDAWEDHP